MEKFAGRVQPSTPSSGIAIARVVKRLQGRDRTCALIYFHGICKILHLQPPGWMAIIPGLLVLAWLPVHLLLHWQWHINNSWHQSFIRWILCPPIHPHLVSGTTTRCWCCYCCCCRRHSSFCRSHLFLDLRRSSRQQQPESIPSHTHHSIAIQHPTTGDGHPCQPSTYSYNILCPR